DPAPPVSTTETGTSVGTSASWVSLTTSGPTRSAYHSPRRAAYAETASGRSASPGGKTAASSTRPLHAAGRLLTRPANNVGPGFSTRAGLGPACPAGRR